MWRVIPELNFAVLGVASFFVISGFLVTQSWLARAGARPLRCGARAADLHPVLIGAVAFTLALAWGIQQRPRTPIAFLGNPQTLDYMLHVTPSWEIAISLAGGVAANPVPA